MRAAHLVTADQLLAWASDRASEGDLPWFIRNLILLEVGPTARIEFDTGRGVGNPGFDGIVETDTGSARVPAGLSVWEVSTRIDVKAKADEDFRKRSDEHFEPEKKNITIVGVSLRRFANRRQWERERRTEGAWKDVRFVDAEDLSLWLDQYPVLAYRMAHKLGLASTQVRGLSEWWESWSSQCSPRLADDWLLSGRSETVAIIQAEIQRPHRSLTLSEAPQLDCLALLYSSIRSMDASMAESLLARTLYVPSVDAFTEVNATVRNAILVPMCDLEDHHAADPSNMVVYCGHPVSSRGSIKVSPIDAHALADLIHRDCQDYHLAWRAAKAARSSVSLMRRELGAPVIPFDLSKVSAADFGAVQAMLLAGRWTDSEDDLRVLSQMSQVTPETFASLSAGLTRSDPPLLRTIGGVTFVTDQDLAFELMGRNLSSAVLRAFKAQLPTVLSDPDPSFELPTEQRWMAGVLAKEPVFSSHLKSGISHALAIIANHYAPMGTYSSGQEFADELVRTVLENSSADKWYSVAGVLSLLAEASPNQFLAILNADLSSWESKVIQGLYFREADAFWGGSRHASLLWALECLAWTSDTLLGSVLVLCRLHEMGFGEETGNNPLSSLREILLPWHPSTNATVEERLSILDLIRQRHPDTAWELQKQLMPQGYSIAHSTSRPQHRAIPQRPPVLPHDVARFYRELLDRVLADTGVSVARLKEVAVSFAVYRDEYFDKALDMLRKASGEVTAQASRRAIWDAMRECWIEHTHLADAEWSMSPKERERYKSVLDLYEPTSTVDKHAWLFTLWGELPLPSQDVEFSEVERIRLQMQSSAVTEVFEARELEGVFALAEQAPHPGTVGRALADAQLLSDKDELSFLRETLGGTLIWMGDLARGYVVRRMGQKGPEWLGELLSNAPSEGLTGVQRSLVYLCSGNRRALWPALASEVQEVQDYYWDRFGGWITGDWSDEDIDMWVARLLERGRVVSLVHHLYVSTGGKPIESLREHIFSALETLVKSSNVTQEQISGLSWRISKMLDKLHGIRCEDVRRVAALEFSLHGVVCHRRRPKALIRLVAEEPTLYFDLLRICYRADNPTEEAAEEDPRAKIACDLLGLWGHGSWSLTEDVSTHDLPSWIATLVRLGNDYGYTKAVSFGVGTVLAKTAPGSDGVWPQVAVCELIEQYRELHHLSDTISVTRANMRGVTCRMPGSGGTLERVESARYSAWAAARMNYPTTHQILRDIASGLEHTARRVDLSDELCQDLG